MCGKWVTNSSQRLPQRDKIEALVHGLDLIAPDAVDFRFGGSEVVHYLQFGAALSGFSFNFLFLLFPVTCCHLSFFQLLPLVSRDPVVTKN